jgi:ketosteroid isomerase-like protein
MSLMKTIVLTAAAAAILAFGAGAAKDDEDAIRDIKKAMRTLNEAFAKGDADGIKRLTLDDHVAITPYFGGPKSIGEQLKNLADLKVPDYAAGEMSVKLLTKDAALVTYPLLQKGTYKGQPVHSKNYAAAVWVNRGGKWLEASYQETPLSEKN